MSCVTYATSIHEHALRTSKCGLRPFVRSWKFHHRIMSAQLRALIVPACRIVVTYWGFRGSLMAPP